MTTSVYPRWYGDATPGFVKNLAEDLVERGHSIRVLAPHFLGCPTESDEDGVSIRRHRYAWPASLQSLCYEGGMLIRLREARWRNALLPTFALGQYLAFRQEIRRFNPDIVHAHSLLPQGWLAAVALPRNNPTPLIVSSHGNDVFGLQGRYMKQKRTTAERSSFLVANSKASRQAILEFCPPEKIATIPAAPNSVSISKEPATAFRTEHGANRKLVVFAGRLIPEKGIELLLDIFPQIRERVPDAKLIVCGDGPLANTVKSILEPWKMAGDAAYLGWVSSDEISSRFSAADVVVVPSQPQKSGWSEALGLVAIEAMAAGSIVVASKLGGLQETIVHGESGFLVDPANREQWIDTIVAALKAPPTQKNAVKRAARDRYLSQYSREASREATEALYRSVVHATD